MASHNEQEIEKEIQDKGLNAPRLKPEDIDAAIVNEQYHVFEGTTLTVCVLTLRNGYTVTGESAAVSQENFDEAIGRKIARENARNKIWQLEGYLLREEQHRRDNPSDTVAGDEAMKAKASEVSADQHDRLTPETTSTAE
jgi:hypothetical protein